MYGDDYVIDLKDSSIAKSRLQQIRHDGSACGKGLTNSCYGSNYHLCNLYLVKYVLVTYAN